MGRVSKVSNIRTWRASSPSRSRAATAKISSSQWWRRRRVISSRSRPLSSSSKLNTCLASPLATRRVRATSPSEEEEAKIVVVDRASERYEETYNISSYAFSWKTEKNERRIPPSQSEQCYKRERDKEKNRKRGKQSVRGSYCSFVGM